MQSKNMKRLICTVLLILLLCVFLFSAYRIYSYIGEERESGYLMNSLIDEAVVPSSDLENEPNAKERPPITVDFNALWETNQDIIAWIYCEGTPINYPIAQRDDNSYYLRRLLDGSYNVAGTLFLDYRCKADFTNCNSIIYGHNMKNDTMFGTLLEYTEQSYYEAHPVMWLLTPEQNYKIELFAGFVTPSDSESYDVICNMNDWKQYIEDALQKSTFTANVESEGIERIITLSTCSYEYGNARYVLLGRLEECG